jgi:DNA invertase Pin-like site-specific DNA recombinase
MILTTLHHQQIILVMQGGLTELYSDNLSKETKKGWHERRAQGLYWGTLPFGAAKREDGIPVTDMVERKITINDHERTVCNYEGLKMAFELGA